MLGKWHLHFFSLLACYSRKCGSEMCRNGFLHSHFRLIPIPYHSQLCDYSHFHGPIPIPTGISSGPTLCNEYGRHLPFYLYVLITSLRFVCMYATIWCTKIHVLFTIFCCHCQHVCCVMCTDRVQAVWSRFSKRSVRSLSDAAWNGFLCCKLPSH